MISKFYFDLNLPTENTFLKEYIDQITFLFYTLLIMVHVRHFKMQLRTSVYKVFIDSIIAHLVVKI